MERAINTLGIAIIASKYAAIFLIAGVSLTAGVSAGETVLLAGIGGNE